MSQKPSAFATKIVASLHSNLQTLEAEFSERGKAASLILRRTESVDEVVEAAFREHLAPAFPQGLSILAVGGYGRRELFPFSDVDLLLLTNLDIQGAALSAFLRQLWDCGLRLSQSVRTVPECCELHQGNIELSISLIDQRLLCGDRGLYEELAARLPNFFNAQRDSLLRHLCRITRARHARFHNTIYHLEPNIKETPGGMRDLHVVHWLSRLREEPDPDGLLNSAREFLSALRCRLHFKAWRDSNFLTFDDQEEIAEDVAQWMREYYRHARVVHRAALRQIEMSESLTEGGLLQSFRDWRSRISNAEFSVHRDRLFFRSPQQIGSDPNVVLRLFQFVGRHNIRLSADVERRISERLPELRNHWSCPGHTWPALKEILAQAHASVALRAMYDTGVLTALIPEWDEIECLVVRDFYHRYTVDEHTLITIEMIEDLRGSTDRSRRRFVDLLSETQDLPLLIMALLFHDTGKSDGHEGHAAASARLAKGMLQRMNMPASEQARVLYLIEHHLDLSAVMSSRDLYDPATARDLADKVGTIEDLKLLTLMTYADISAVNPEAMTSWRLEQLWRVYAVTQRELTRELDSERIHLAAGSNECTAFLEGLPTRYLRTHSAEEIDAHVGLEKQCRDSGVAVNLQRKNGDYVATIITADRPNLFASLAGALSSFGMDILKAEAFANGRGTVVDTFSFADRMRTLELNPPEVDRLKLTLQRVALGKEDVKRLLKGRVRSIPRGRKQQIRTSVGFDDDVSESATLVQIVAEDRPALLYDLAAAFSSHGCSIDVVLIDTEAHKALDVFYVTEKGAKLAAATQSQLRTELLTICGG